MLSFVRRSRALALSMVMLAPGITGTAVQWLHACPAEAQAAATPDHQHHDSGPAQPDHAQGCECIGSCNASSAGTPPSATITAAVVVEPRTRSILPSRQSFVPSGPATDLLPPATAPPLS